MDRKYGSILGTVFFEGALGDLSAIFRANGIEAVAGPWALRFPELSARLRPGRVELQYVGNITPEEPYVFEGDGWELSDLAEIGKVLSNALAKANIPYDVAVHNENQDLVAQFSHR